MSESAGRPRGFESRRRTRLLVELIATGTAPIEAVRKSGVSSARVVRLLEDPAFLAVLRAGAELREAAAA